MRLLFVSNVYPTPWQPTRGMFNRGLVDSLRRAGHDVRCVVPVNWIDWIQGHWRGKSSLAPEAQSVYPIWFYPPKVFRASYHSWLWVAIRRSLRRVTRNWRPDAVLGFWVHPDAAVAIRFARELGVPGVAFAGGSDLLVVIDDAARRDVISGVLREADAVFTDGQHLRETAIALGADRSRVHAFYRGVDPEVFHPGDRIAARRQLAIAGDARLLLAVGNLVHVKGFDVLLEALAKAAVDAPWKLVIIGDGAQRTALQQQAATLGISSQVRFEGSVAHSGLGAWYRAADFVVLPSRSEGVPNVLLEALVSGTPFVASAVGGVPEITPDPSWLVPPDDPVALARALCVAHRAPAPVTTAASFDWTATATQIVDVIQQCCVDVR